MIEENINDLQDNIISNQIKQREPKKKKKTQVHKIAHQEQTLPPLAPPLPTSFPL